MTRWIDADALEQRLGAVIQEQWDVWDDLPRKNLAGFLGMELRRIVTELEAQAQEQVECENDGECLECAEHHCFARVGIAGSEDYLPCYCHPLAAAPSPEQQLADANKRIAELEAENERLEQSECLAGDSCDFCSLLAEK